MSAPTAARVDAAFTAPSTALFFDALTAADQHAHDADYNALLARTAPTPDTFASCVCGAELSIVTTAIALTDEELDAAADALADQFGVSAPITAQWRPQVRAIIAAVNAARGEADERFAADFRDAHAYCSGDDQ